jgi:hypothetical protein
VAVENSSLVSPVQNNMLHEKNEVVFSFRYVISCGKDEVEAILPDRALHREASTDSYRIFSTI